MTLECLIINGSPSEASRTALLCARVGAALVERGLKVSALALRELPAEPLVRGRVDDPALRRAVVAFEAAPAVVLATPIYKAAYTGLLKLFLDLLPQLALADKHVLPLGTAGSPANILALDYALRPVLASMGAQHVGLSFVALDRQIDLASGQLEPEAEQRLGPILDSFADSLRRYT